ncbi:MAG: UvrD-helicase domain-containing protein [Myxococcota bacterium]
MSRVVERRNEDAACRALATREFLRPLVVEAGAGTGKTATLVARILSWCLGPGWERAAASEPDATAEALGERVLRGVVAITFTEAAAAEMDARTDAALALLAKGESPIGFEGDAPPERIVALRAGLDHLSIQTIHGYCRRLLAGHPLEAGLHPRFEVDADGRALATVAREVLREAASRAYAADDADWLFLAERGIGPQELEAEVVRLRSAGVDPGALAADPLAPDRVGSLTERIAAARGDLRAALGDLDASGGRLRKARAVVEALAVDPTPLGAAGAGLSEGLDEIASLWSASARNAVTDWSRGRFSAAEREALGSRCPEVQAAARGFAALLKHVERLDPPMLVHAGRVLSGLLTRVDAELHRTGRLGFEDLLTRTAALLRDSPGVAARLRTGIDQLLVDEFQDTDPRQCAIVEALALSGPAGDRPGLFLVGDPKQSIYGWRSADLAAYEAMLAKVDASSGLRGRLSVNFRSVPAVLDEVECVMEPRMQREPGVQPGFEGLAPRPGAEAAPGFTTPDHAPIEYWVTAGRDAEGGLARIRATDAARIEADALAADLRALHDEHGVAWRDVGVLFRSRGEWDVYLGALRAAGVPFRVEGDRTYYRRREVIDASALVAAVLDPNDGIAAVATLRSSLAAVPDAAWLPLWAGRFPALWARLGEDPEALSDARDLVRRVGAETSSGSAWAAAAEALLETLAALRRSLAVEAGDVFVERLRSATGFECSEAARFLGHWRVANLEHFFDGLASRLADPTTTLADVLRELRRGVAEEESPSVEPAPLDTRDAVSVVTLHGAKGLDWDHVYLMQLHKGEASAANATEIGRVDDALEACWFDAPTLGYDRLIERRRRVTEAERVRTLYVGMTRARERLVLCGAWPETLQRSAPSSHVALLEGRPPGALAFADAMREATAGEGFLDAGGARWRFLVAGEVTALQSTNAPEATLFDPEPAPCAVSPARAERKARIGVTEMAARRAGVVPLVSSEAQETPGVALGIAVHAALAELTLDAENRSDWSAEWSTRGETVTRILRQRGRSQEEERAGAAFWDALGEGPLADRLFERRSQVAARELSLMLPAEGDPADVAVGSIDLLLDDPDVGLVVVDYKTDRADSQGIPARYREQLRLYGAAVHEALGLAQPPRLEIWWLGTGEIDRLDPAGADDRAPLPAQLSLLPTA